MKWHPHTEQPNEAELGLYPTALIAYHDESGESDPPLFLLGMYTWRGGQWVSEDTGQPIANSFWWSSESELLAPLAADIEVQQS